MTVTASKYLDFQVLRQRCGQLPVVLGAAPAADLCALSFADVLDEAKEQGYQRPIDPRHSREFRSYIDQPGATTIPLTLNLRGQAGVGLGWILSAGRDGELATLSVRVPSPEHPAVLAQVDCQHRLGMMNTSPVPLTFQCFLGLSPSEEMAIFGIINGKAKGLNSSLLDYHQTQLLPDLEFLQQELFIAKRLSSDPDSVWHGLVKLGGGATQGSQRRISLRGLQTATKALVQHGPLGSTNLPAIEKYRIVRDFWLAAAHVWKRAWEQPRTHLIAKGVGVGALSLLARDIITVALSRRQPLTYSTFVEYLGLISNLDWSTSGLFKGFGGRKGANEAHQLLAAQLFAPGLAVARANP